MKDVKAGEWVLFSTEVTDKTGRITYQIPQDKALNYGVYPIKMIVRYETSLFIFKVIRSFRHILNVLDFSFQRRPYVRRLFHGCDTTKNGMCGL